jgi:two-component system cell cycle response regulator CtrA
MRVLVVEDDDVSLKSVQTVLGTITSAIDRASDGEEALELCLRYDYDLVILDVLLPDMEGYEVIRKLRAARNETPVLMLSGLSRPQAKARGLSLGADDFMTKPFDNSEFIARVRAIIRRSRGFSDSRISINGVNIDLEKNKAYVGSNEICLTIKEYQILELLVMRKGMIISKSSFLDHLYGGIDEPEIKIIDVFVCKLRKKLSSMGVDQFIETSWGRGYVVNEKFTNNDSRHSEISLRVNSYSS